MKKLTGLEQRALIAMYEARDQGGDLVELLNGIGIGVSLDKAHEIANSLAERGYIKDSPARGFAEVDLTKLGIDYVAHNLI